MTEKPTTTIIPEDTTTIEEVTTQEATTEDPSNVPKSGEVELLVEDIVFSGHMLHWSAREQYLSISDIWGQKYLRFEEIPPATTTAAPDTTTESVDTRNIDDTTTTTIAGTTTTTTDGTTTTTADTTTTETPVTTTEIPTTTEEPLPYDLKTFEVSKDVVWNIRRHLETEGHFPLLIPVDDYGYITEYEDDFIFAFENILHVGHWDMESGYTNMTSIEWHNTPKINMKLKKFHVPSPAWIDPSGKMLIGSKDIRKFENAVTNAEFSKLPNSFELFSTFKTLSEISCKPNGMAWSTDNSTLYASDGHNATITKCVYNMYTADVSNCSTIDLDDENLVDVVFGGEDLDFLYILSKTNLYKLTGMGVIGMHVPDFVWNPDEKRRSIRLQNSS